MNKKRYCTCYLFFKIVHIQKSFYFSINDKDYEIINDFKYVQKFCVLI